jgi:hypothetical protein
MNMPTAWLAIVSQFLPRNRAKHSCSHAETTLFGTKNAKKCLLTIAKRTEATFTAHCIKFFRKHNPYKRLQQSEVDF